ncbi:MAG: hypothetical protein ACYTEQ_27620 [Planctomycetota bacterium]|jgi:hypothetical protein
MREVARCVAAAGKRGDAGTGGGKDAGTVIFETVCKLASEVNDARQLKEIISLRKDLKGAKTTKVKGRIKERMKAHSELFSKQSGELLKEVLKPVLK